jgi:hypothetical protein
MCCMLPRTLVHHVTPEHVGPINKSCSAFACMKQELHDLSVHVLLLHACRCNASIHSVAWPKMYEAWVRALSITFRQSGCIWTVRIAHVDGLGLCANKDGLSPAAWCLSHMASISRYYWPQDPIAATQTWGAVPSCNYYGMIPQLPSCLHVPAVGSGCEGDGA